MERIDSNFLSGGLKCAGWLFLPDSKGKHPVVVMAHGFAAERSLGLEAIAERFVAEGIAAFVFDYRNFGDSDGEPRNLVSPKRHLEDWEAAVRYVKLLKEVDGERMALWGTSFSGGHVLVTASRIPGISAVVSQVPFVDGLDTARYLGIRFVLRALPEGLRDLLRIITLRKPHYIPVVGRPDDFAVMNTPDSYEGYISLIPEGSSWQNRCPARILFTAMLYRPIKSAANISCPVLIVCAEKDSLIPAEAVKRTAGLIKRAELVVLPAMHFEVYSGEVFEKVVEIEARFLKEHLFKEA